MPCSATARPPFYAHESMLVHVPTEPPDSHPTDCGGITHHHVCMPAETKDTRRKFLLALFSHQALLAAVGPTPTRGWRWWPARSISSPRSPFERVLVRPSSASESPPAPPLPAPRCRPPFPTPHFSRTLSVHVAHRLSTSFRPLCLLPARVARSAGVLYHPLRVLQARIGTRRHHRDRDRRDRLGRHFCRPARRITDATFGRASSVARARALYPAHPGIPALAVPCACNRSWWQRLQQQRL